MSKKTKPTDFETALDIKLDKAHASGLRKCDFVQVTNTETNKYLFIDPTNIDSVGCLTSTTVPTCVTLEDFAKVVSTLQFHFDEETLDQLSFDGVMGVSTTDFIDPNGWHTLS